MSDKSEEVETEEIEIELESDDTSEDQAAEQEQEQESAEEPVAAAEPEPEQESEGSDDELEDYSKNVQKRIKQLTDKYRKEERDKQEALRLSSQLIEENKKMKDRLRLLDRGYVQEYGNRLNIEMNTAKMQYKDAADRGDSDKMLEAQEKLSRLNNEMERHRQAKARVEREAKQPQQQQPEPAQQVQQQAQQPQAPQPDPRAQAWAEKNEWFGTDRLLTSAAYAIHATLVEDEGFDPNTEEYYTEIDRRIRSEFPNKFQTSKKSGNGAPVASGNSSASRSTKKGRRSVKLTHSQVAIAKKLGVPLEEYAKFVKD